jgi:hypothetical protein
MNTTPPNTTDNQEIDLSQISKKIGNVINKLNRAIFNLIKYIQRYFIFLLLFIGIATAIGYFLNGSNKYYESRIIVTPNYGSTNYLYSQIEFVNSNLISGNIKFLKSIGMSNNITSIKIDAIVDIYRLANDSEKNYELIKLLSEEGEFSKILKDETTSRNFKQHQIVINSNGLISNEELNLFLNFLNTNEYYQKLQREVLNNIIIKIKSNQSMIEQIDNILNDFPKDKTSTNLIYNNQNFDFNELIKFKNELLVEQGNREIELLNYSKITKENSIIINISKDLSILKNYMILTPLFFLFSFLFIKLFISYYKKQNSLI